MIMAKVRSWRSNLFDVTGYMKRFILFLSVLYMIVWMLHV